MKATYEELQSALADALVISEDTSFSPTAELQNHWRALLKRSKLPPHRRGDVDRVEGYFDDVIKVNSMRSLQLTRYAPREGVKARSAWASGNNKDRVSVQREIESVIRIHNEDKQKREVVRAFGYTGKLII